MHRAMIDWCGITLDICYEASWDYSLTSRGKQLYIDIDSVEVDGMSFETDDILYKKQPLIEWIENKLIEGDYE